MEFKKLILVLSIISVNILQCADSQKQYSSLGLSDIASAKTGVALDSLASSISECCGDQKLTAETAAKLKKQNEELTVPNRCIIDPNDPKVKKEMMKEHSVYPDEEKEFDRLLQKPNMPELVRQEMMYLHAKIVEDKKNNLKKAKENAKNVMAVLDGKEAPLGNHLKIIMAKAMAKMKNAILSYCDEKTKKETEKKIKDFFKISNMHKLFEQLFPEIMDYCKDWHCIQTLNRNSNGHEDAVWCITNLGNDLFASGSEDNSIKIWQFNNDQFVCIQTIDANTSGHTGWVFALTNLGNGFFASGSEGNSITIWQLKNDQFVCIQTIDVNTGGHTGWVFALTNLGNGFFVSGSRDRTIKIWQLKNDQFVCIQTIDENTDGHTGWVYALTNLGNDLFASGSMDSSIKIWQLNNDQFVCIQTIDANTGGHTGWVYALTNLGNGFFASGSRDRTIKIWQLKNDQFVCIQTIDANTGGHTGWVYALTNLGNDLFASGSENNSIKIWQLKNDQFVCIQTIDENTDGHTGSVLALTNLGNDLFASCSEDNSIKIWHLDSENQEHELAKLAKKIKIEREPLQEEHLIVGPVPEEQSWLNCLWKNKYKITLGLAGAFAAYKIVQKLRKA